jgi:hypothetical protein
MVMAVLASLAISPARAAQFRLTTGGRIVEPVARLLYFVGLPYAALLTKSLSPIDLGLAGTSGPLLGWSSVDWLRQLNALLIVGIFTLIPIGLAARQMARLGKPLGVDERSAGAIIIDAAYSEAHWAFYRAAPLIILNDIYWATLIGLMLVGVEILVTIVRNGVGKQPEERQAWIGQTLLLAMSATLFILTGNVWLVIVLHIVVELLLKWWALHLAGHGAVQPAIPREAAEPIAPIEQRESPIV